MKTLKNESYYLIATTQKSYYKKAQILVENNVSTLYSYDTKIATYNHESKTLIINGWYSKTTAIHINDFIKLFGFNRLSKKDLINGQSLINN